VTGLRGKTIRLNDRWRVRLDDPLQWVLEVCRSRLDHYAPRYQANAFCATRMALIRNIRERCGEVEPGAMARVLSLPESKGRAT